MFKPSTRVLIVEDSIPMLQAIKGELRRVGFQEFCTANDGEAALALLKAQAKAGEPIELILSDWHMPKMSGLDLLIAVRADAELKHLPFIMITAEGETSQVVKAAHAGVTTYMVKPISGQAIREKLGAAYKKTISRGT